MSDVRMCSYHLPTLNFKCCQSKSSIEICLNFKTNTVTTLIVLNLLQRVQNIWTARVKCVPVPSVKYPNHY